MRRSDLDSFSTAADWKSFRTALMGIPPSVVGAFGADAERTQVVGVQAHDGQPPSMADTDAKRRSSSVTTYTSPTWGAFASSETNALARDGSNRTAYVSAISQFGFSSMMQRPCAPALSHSSGATSRNAMPSLTAVGSW